MVYRDFLEVISTYGSFLEIHNDPVNDERVLPFSKVEIKQALLLGLRFIQEVDQRNFLKFGFVALSTFQKLTENEALALARWNRGICNPELPTSTNSARDSQCGEIVVSLLKKAADEADTLVRELKSEGF